MGTLQKFKLLATQCSIPNSPTRSPTTSPIIHLRGRKTLRMFLTRGGTDDVCRRLPPPSNRKDDDSPEKTKFNSCNVKKNNKLKDLFVSSSSSSSPPRSEELSGGVGGESGWRGGSARAVRPWSLSLALRQRLLRKTWRPLLVTIHE